MYPALVRRWSAISVLAVSLVAFAAVDSARAAPPDTGPPDTGPPDTVPTPTLPSATDDGSTDGDAVGDAVAPGADGRRSLVEVPSGCVEPTLPDVVFVGTLVDRDYRTGRFQIEQVRAGDEGPFEAGGLIDVRYGLDVEFLDVGDDYLVSARRDPVLGTLGSRLRPPSPMFGGDDIIGLVESEVVCPGFEDPVRTLRPNGATVNTSVIGPLLEQRSQILGAVLVPFAVAFGVVFLFASLRVSLTGLFRGLGRAATARRRR